MIKVSAFSDQVIEILKDLKYMIFSKVINTDNIRKLQIAVTECENILDILNKHIQTLNMKKEFR